MKKIILNRFVKYYPTRGKLWCINNLSLTDNQVRYYAQKFNLKSSFKFNKIANYKRGSSWRDKKRIEHSNWLKKNHPLKGKHHSQKTKNRISRQVKKAVKDGRVKNDNFKGYHHTLESKNKISIANSGRIVSKQTIKKILATKIKKYGYIHKNTENAYSRCKRGWYDINGKRMYFRSKWEANYALFLDFLERRKEIVSWEYEKDTFWFEKIRRGIRSYTPDFKILNKDNSIHYEELKGWMDRASKTKIKRMAKYHPDIKLIVIDSKVYLDLEKKLGRLLNFY